MTIDEKEETLRQVAKTVKVIRDAFPRESQEADHLTDAYIATLDALAVVLEQKLA